MENPFYVCSRTIYERGLFQSTDLNGQGWFLNESSRDIDENCSEEILQKWSSTSAIQTKQNGGI